MPIQSKLLAILERAHELKASDIHFVMKNEKMCIEFRVGAFMVPYEELLITQYESLLAYIKFQASLSLMHPKQPQSGLLRFQNQELTYYCRVSILPTQHYQSLVLRLINHTHQKQLHEIPYFYRNVAALQQMATKQAGLLLISGPTGSGKTTTTYALIDYLKQELGKSIVTIEDPVEYQQPDIIQMQVNETMGMTYDVGIKEILRHDPDVIIIGEIRDSQTARQALRAAFTGHLVISTVHAKNVLGTINRLLDLGITLQELEQGVIGVANQRLIKFDDEQKALFELCFDDHLDVLFHHLNEGSPVQPSYLTLDEEFSQCQQQRA
ncbi:competence type IV pilus ATPase ComGA [Turicibacter sanguinis]|uniref:competence type IV pilus ATPase ComGA n=1 Tax=Turicibacter sanguinis TaxID=154288 RepID=UPI00189D2C7B|nr:competence type IV pilus ATPase ComGA [Turicibacter sanguinis]